MANAGFNGSTIVFNSITLGSLRGISYSGSAPEVDIGDASDTDVDVVTGRVKKTVTVDVVGGTLPAEGSTGALTIAWFDGTTRGALTNAICVSADIKGQMDGEITGTCTFAKTPA